MYIPEYNDEGSGYEKNFVLINLMTTRELSAQILRLDTHIEVRESTVHDFPLATSLEDFF